MNLLQNLFKKYREQLKNALKEYDTLVKNNNKLISKLTEIIDAITTGIKKTFDSFFNRFPFLCLVYLIYKIK